MPEEKTWQKNAGSQIILDSIFAALAAALVGIVVGPEFRDVVDHSLAPLRNWLQFAELSLQLFSFFLFAMSAEGTANAYEEKDVHKFVYYLLWYNVGVVCIGLGLAILVGAHFVTHIASVCQRVTPGLPLCRIEDFIVLLMIVVFVICLWNWIRDAWWLTVCSKEEFTEYLQMLTDENPNPKPRPTLVMKVFYKVRSLW